MNLIEALKKIKKNEVITRSSWPDSYYIPSFQKNYRLSEIFKYNRSSAFLLLDRDDLGAEDYKIISKKRQEKILNAIDKRLNYLLNKGFSSTYKPINNSNRYVVCLNYETKGKNGTLINIIFDTECVNFYLSIGSAMSGLINNLTSDMVEDLAEINIKAKKIQAELLSLSKN